MNLPFFAHMIYEYFINFLTIQRLISSFNEPISKIDKRRNIYKDLIKLLYAVSKIEKLKFPLFKIKWKFLKKRFLSE